MNTKKHKATAALTIQDFPPSSRYSIKTLNPKLSSIILTQKNTLFSEIACQTRDNRCNNTMDQDLPNNSATTWYYQQTESTIHEITSFIQNDSQQ